VKNEIEREERDQTKSPFLRNRGVGRRENENFAVVELDDELEENDFC